MGSLLPPLAVAAPEILTMDALRDELRYYAAPAGVCHESFIVTAGKDELVDMVRKDRVRRSVEAKPLLIMDPHTYDYSFTGHAGAGPSASERWMSCTASLQASRAFLETLTPNQQAEFAQANLSARQGTTAHSAGEVKLRHMLGEIEEEEMASVLLDLTYEPPDGEEFTDEMDDHLEEYVEHIRMLADQGHEIHVEARSDAVVPVIGRAAELLGDDVYVVSGRGDAIGLPTEEDPTLYVGDLKYGNGIDVSVEGNPQLRIYALGALNLLADDDGYITTPIEWVEYIIVQPRLGGIKVSREPLEALLSWRDQHLTPALSNALAGIEGGAQFRPSEDACQFCPARSTCPALTEQRMAAGADLFDAITDAEVAGEVFDPLALSDARLGELLTQALAISNIKDDLRAEAQRRLHRGQAVPGYDLRNYSPPRHWVEGADEKLRNNPRFWAEPKMKTPTQALAMYKAEGKEVPPKLEALIVKPDIRPVISTGPKDKRKVWTERAPEDMFTTVEEGDDA